MTVTYYEIPLDANNQLFSVTLAGKLYQMQLIYRNTTEGGWFLDIFDASGNPLIYGISLVTGVDLLSPYPDAGIGGSLYVATDGDPFAVPTYDNLGTNSHLYFGVTS